ncbi:MAG TPA: hypothetical protein DEQ98_12180, partial [Acidobacteria bacterium]|nr:hypothetical protein [Acidobacteriota bacterium]
MPYTGGEVTLPRRIACALAVVALALVVSNRALLAHPMEGTNAGFVQSVDGPAPGPFLYLGAKHMVTGYDH